MNFVDRIEVKSLVRAMKWFLIVSILMPWAWWPDDVLATAPFETVAVSLLSGANGELTAIQIEAEKPMTGPDAIGQLQRRLAAMFKIARDAGQAEPEVWLRIDDNLRFQEVVKGILAVTKSTASDGTEVPLATSVRLQTQGFRVGLNQEYLKYLEKRGKERLKLSLDAP